MSSSPLEVLLQQMAETPEFNNLPQKNWDKISKMIPGTTPYQCQQRYKEILQEKLTKEASAINGTKESDRESSRPSSTMLPYKYEREGPLSPDAEEASGGNSRSVESKANNRPASKFSSVSDLDAAAGGDGRPTMVIHVCDEAQNLKKDFYCRRDLLVKEMKYFAEYLSTDTSRTEDVDISVHCDVKIFEWLMKYVKRGTENFPRSPTLEKTNVISILISSDFLKMKGLVQQCIEYCHQHMDEILATPCNMNCINDRLVTRIADMFNHNEADRIKDRKDKFKNKIFAKKCEHLFDAEKSKSNKDSPESGITLYRCHMCEQLLTKNTEKLLKCGNRMTIDRHGEMIYLHVRDPEWDVNEYLLDLKSTLKHWRDVYWRVWGTINFLHCSRCGVYFRCKEYSGCLYHPEEAVYAPVKRSSTAVTSSRNVSSIGSMSGSVSSGSASGSVGSVGTYSCCSERVLRFESCLDVRGCQVRDHVVSSSRTAFQRPQTPSVEMKTSGTVYEDMMARRDIVCETVEPRVTFTVDNGNFSVFANDELASGVKEDSTGLDAASGATHKHETASASSSSAPKFQPLTVEEFSEVGGGLDHFTGDESEQTDDEVGDDESSVPGRRRMKRREVTLDPSAILVDGPEFETHRKNRWDMGRSLRFNQDSQRQEDVKRFRDIIGYLTELRLGTDKQKNKTREFAGGLFMKLEAQWRTNYINARNARENAATKGKSKANSNAGGYLR